MNAIEFKAWFEGFGEAIEAAPTPEQWAKIKAKVAQLQDRAAAIHQNVRPGSLGPLGRVGVWQGDQTAVRPFE